MPERDKKRLHALVVQAIKESGWDVLYLPENLDNALRIKVYRDDQQFTLRVYIWNLTHGGGVRRPTSEYRIQITGVDAILLEPDETTLLLGWWEPEHIFAAFDATKHTGPFGRSPSIQIGEDALRSAVQNGMTPYAKGNGEVAFGIRPDFLVEYAERSGAVHEFGESDETVEQLRQATQDAPGVNESPLPSMPEERRVALRSVREKVRTARFQRAVLAAYSYQCAMCKTQLELVEAAHIVPVADSRSTDNVINGVALCVLHHRAYDRALVTIKVIENQYRIALNMREIIRLRQINHASGFDKFKQGLITPQLFVPDAVASRPSKDFIRVGNELRGWDDLGDDEMVIVI